MHPHAIVPTRFDHCVNTDDDGMCARLEGDLGAFDTSDTAADTAGQPFADCCSHSRVVAVSLRGVQIDQLDTREAGEPLDPHFRVSRLDRQLLSLDELDDAAALQINRRDQHVNGP